ncbi:winged helix-turn-helix transcriptional regulator [Kribbella sp. NPDC004875]|uniref:winged helix-turn-helix transcriptional regulator n=1 Tax=Kribbella sp. NPDC004875 TaxID=3364107 RepID=UPI0036808B31
MPSCSAGTSSSEPTEPSLGRTGLIGGISKKALTQTLRRLQTNGLVARTDHGGVPSRVEYELTARGRALMGPIRLRTEWAEEDGDAVLAAQEGG